jgi:CDK-activating kinase assembly factor MAT1
LAVYNKTATDFATLKDYNDYLEEVEDMIYSIVNEEADAEECKAKIKEYEQAHRAEIVVRQSQRADEERAIQDLIAAESEVAKRNRLEAMEIQKAIAVTKRKYKQESTEVALGEREEVSAELTLAQMQGYKNEIKRIAKGPTGRGTNLSAGLMLGARVREPKNGWKDDHIPSSDFYRKRQAAGGGIPVGNIASQERNWNETVASLFGKKQTFTLEKQPKVH